jgi:hypothetical protein
VRNQKRLWRKHTSEQKIEGVVQGLKYKTTDTIYDLFFTESKFVAAIVLQPSDLAKMYSSHSVLTILTGGKYTEREIKARQLEVMNERRLALKDKTADEILVISKVNFEVGYRNVVAVKIKKGMVTISLEFVIEGHPETKISFWIERNQIAEVEEMARRFLPNKLE